MKLKQSQIAVNAKLVFKLAWERCVTATCIPKYAYSPLEKRSILAFYMQAQQLNFTTKKRYEVDHIIPLNHPQVCGLHVASNLQVITKTKNTNKSNNFTPYSEKNGKKYHYTELKLPTLVFKTSKTYNKTKKNPLKLAKKRLKTRANKLKTCTKRLNKRA